MVAPALSRITYQGGVYYIVTPELLRPIVPFFGPVALTVILAGGGYRLKLDEVAAAAPRALLLALLGFVFSIGAVCAFFRLMTAMGLAIPVSPLF